MSRAIYKDNDKTQFDLKVIRRTSNQYKYIADTQEEEKESIFVQFKDFTNCPVSGGGVCSAGHDPRCKNWDRFGIPIRPIVQIPIPARMTKSGVLKYPPTCGFSRVVKL